MIWQDDTNSLRFCLQNHLNGLNDHEGLTCPWASLDQRYVAGVVVESRNMLQSPFLTLKEDFSVRLELNELFHLSLISI
jgi:hypothetical protein